MYWYWWIYIWMGLDLRLILSSKPVTCLNWTNARFMICFEIIHKTCHPTPTHPQISPPIAPNQQNCVVMSKWMDEIYTADQPSLQLHVHMMHCKRLSFFIKFYHLFVLFFLILASSDQLTLGCLIFALFFVLNFSILYKFWNLTSVVLQSIVLFSR